MQSTREKSLSVSLHRQYKGEAWSRAKLTWKTHLPRARTSPLNPKLRAWNDHVALIQWNAIGRRGGSASTWINQAALVLSYFPSLSTIAQCFPYA